MQKVKRKSADKDMGEFSRWHLQKKLGLQLNHQIFILLNKRTRDATVRLEKINKANEDVAIQHI